MKIKKYLLATVFCAMLFLVSCNSTTIEQSTQSQQVSSEPVQPSSAYPSTDDGMPKLQVLNPRMNYNGCLVWDYNPDVDMYEVEVDGFRTHTLSQSYNVFSVEGKEARVRAICTCGKHRNGDFTEVFTFDSTEIENATNTLYFKYSSINNYTVDGDFSTFSITASNNESYSFTAYKLVVENQKMTLKEGGYIYSNDRIGGIYKINLEPNQVNNPMSLVRNAFYFQDKTVTDISEFEKTSYAFRFPEGGSRYLDMVDYLVIDETTEEYNIPSFTIFFVGGKASINTAFDAELLGRYVEGEYYRISDETAVLFDGSPKFHVNYTPVNSVLPLYETDSLYYLTKIEEIKLYNNNDQEISKDSRVYKGYYVTIKDGNITSKVELPFLTPVEDDYVNPTLGNVHAIVIPYVFSDQLDRKEIAIDELKKAIGRINDGALNITDYNVNDEYLSLTEYYDIASYGKINIDAFITDFYYDERTYDSARYTDVEAVLENLEAWFEAKYSSLDLSQFDLNNDNRYDAVIFFNLGDMTGYSDYFRTGFSGAYVSSNRYERTKMSNHMSVNLGFLYDDHTISGNPTSITLLHEFGHILNLDDYYDNSGKIAPVGDYDMQSANAGDWNAFSKYTAGWIEPLEITDDLFGENNTYTTTISSFSTSGDAIIIRADSSNNSCGEYLIIDLFDGSSGLNKYFSEYNLTNTVGVRIEHVNNIYYRSSNWTRINGVRVYPVCQNYSNYYNQYGYYLLSMIQAGGKNTFTVPYERQIVADEDYFKEGDIFTSEKYSEFFGKDGGMVNGYKLKYSISIDKIEYDASTNTYKATLTFTKLV